MKRTRTLGPPIMYAPPNAAMAQQHQQQQHQHQHQHQQVSKQQGQQYNQNPSSSTIGVNDDYYGRGSSSAVSNKDAQYMYAVPSQAQQMPAQSAGQQHHVNKQQQQQQQQQQQRTGGVNAYNNQQRPFQ